MAVDTIFPVGFPPPAVSIRLARKHLRLPADDPTEDATMLLYLQAAQQSFTADLDCPTTVQEFVEHIETPRMVGRSLRLSMRPVVEILDVEDVGDFTQVGNNLVVADGVTLPATRLVVRYRAGWTPEELPAPIRVGILMQMADLYAMRETLQIGTGAPLAINPVAERLTRAFRRYN